jgi:hypothetical protein
MTKKKKKKATGSDTGDYIALLEISFPSPDTLHIVTGAGGMSKLSPEQLDQVVIEHLKPGDSCENLPQVSVASQLKRGAIRKKKEGE